MRKQVFHTQQNLNTSPNNTTVISRNSAIIALRTIVSLRNIVASSCLMMLFLFNHAVADTIPQLGPHSGPPIQIESRTERLTSSMQVYLSPVTGKPIPANHPDRVSQLMSPIRAQSTTEQSPLVVLTSDKEKGGKFVITGPRFRSHMDVVTLANGETVGQCTIGPGKHLNHPLQSSASNAHQHVHQHHDRNQKLLQNNAL